MNIFWVEDLKEGLSFPLKSDIYGLHRKQRTQLGSAEACLQNQISRDYKMDLGTLIEIDLKSLFVEKASVLHMLILLTQNKEDTIAICVDPPSKALVRHRYSFSFFLVLTFALMVRVWNFQIKSFLMDTSTLLLFQGTHQETHIIDVHFWCIQIKQKSTLWKPKNYLSFTSTNFSMFWLTQHLNQNFN